MKTVLRFSSLLLALAVLPAAAGPGTGFVPLFNGKDLAGWTYGASGKGHGKGYQVDKGVLYSTHEDGGNLFSEKEYGDFTLRFEFRLTANANNGIAIRAPLLGDSAYVGMEIQILDDTGSDYRSLHPEQYHGSIYDVVAARRGSLKPVGQWNEEEIRASGRHIVVTVNDKVVVDANLDDIKDAAVLKKHPGLANARGHLCFRGHGSRVEFRNIRIREP